MDPLSLIFGSGLSTYAFFITVYAFLGGSIKYIDDAFDERVFSRRNALLLAPLVGIFWAFAMSISAPSATILGAVVLAVLLTGKIDTIAFQAGLVSIFGVLAISGFFNFMWIPLAVIAFAGIVDEIGNDHADRNPKTHFLINNFFHYRFTMKLAVLAFAFLGTFGWVYIFAFLAFDIAYLLVTKYSDELRRLRKFYYEPKTNNIAGKKV